MVVLVCILVLGVVSAIVVVVVGSAVGVGG